MKNKHPHAAVVLVLGLAMAGLHLADLLLWSEADTGYRLYETQDALYLAFWDWDNTHPWHLAWLVKLAPKAASSNDDVYFYPGTDRDDLVNLYEWEGDLHG